MKREIGPSLIKERTNMREIIDILMQRDGMTYDEARRFLKEVREEIAGAIENQTPIEEIEDIVMSELGLHPDYIMLFLE